MLSHLGFRVANGAAFHRAVSDIQAGIARYAAPFNLILAKAELPPAVQDVDGYHCVAESLISKGRQCTVEGYAWAEEIVVYGVIDSLLEGPEGSSFSRFQYPSTLPPRVIERMTVICQRVIPYIGYVNSPFNIEFFWDEESDQIWLLEINPRISKSHAPLFHKVDGRYHHQIMLDLALGRQPEFPRRQGRFACAAKFMVRRYEDALVTRTPSPEELRGLEVENPSVTLDVAVKAGMRLSALRDQDSYSYEVATLFIGGDSTAELEAKYHDILERLPLEFSPLLHEEPGTRHIDSPPCIS